jgi:peptide/nickel transport system permease protein
MSVPGWMRSARVLAGLALIVALVAAAALAPLAAPHDPLAHDLGFTLQPVRLGGTYPLGTDALGRCVLSRLLHGLGPALLVAAAAALGAMLLGGGLGIAAGYFGGWTDRVAARLEAAWLAFPPVILALLLTLGFGAGRVQVVVEVVLADWPRFCRALRRAVQAVMRRDHVAAARLSGFGHGRTLWREVLPATWKLLATLLVSGMALAVAVETTLGFLGFGVRVDTVGLGRMIADGRETLHQAPAGRLAPALVVVAAVAGFNLLADGLRRTLAVRLVEGGR